MSTQTKSKSSGKKPSGAKGGAEEAFSFGEYFKGVKQEWHKITWPSWEQVIAETGVVIAVVSFFSVFVLVVDKIFKLIINIIS